MGKRSIPANLGGIIIIDTAAFMRASNIPWLSAEDTKVYHGIKSTTFYCLSIFIPKVNAKCHCGNGENFFLAELTDLKGWAWLLVSFSHFRCVESWIATQYCKFHLVDWELFQNVTCVSVTMSKSVKSFTLKRKRRDRKSGGENLFVAGCFAERGRWWDECTLYVIRGEIRGT